jgi:DNA modification methylase
MLELNQNIILNGSCLDLFKQLPDNYADLAVTDCPYKIATGGCTVDIGTGGILRAKDKLKNKWLKQNCEDSVLLVKTGKLEKICLIWKMLY